VASSLSFILQRFEVYVQCPINYYYYCLF